MKCIDLIFSNLSERRRWPMAKLVVRHALFRARAREQHVGKTAGQHVGDTIGNRRGEDGQDDGESVGHASGRRIVAIKRTKKADLTDEDYAHMKKVVGYVHRHMAQGGPAEDKEHSNWRYSLMNWGHDPLKS